MYDQRLMYDMVTKLTWDGPQENMVMDGDTMIDRRAGEVLDPEVDFTYSKRKFCVKFCAFVDHKITCCRVEGLRVLNDTDTLTT